MSPLITKGIFSVIKSTFTKSARAETSAASISFPMPLPFGRLWHDVPNAVSNPVDYAKFRGRSHDAVIRVYDAAGNVVETHEHEGDFKEW
jgi:hypothetical protein